jgi:hypothetical protein
MDRMGSVGLPDKGNGGLLRLNLYQMVGRTQRRLQAGGVDHGRNRVVGQRQEGSVKRGRDAKVGLIAILRESERRLNPQPQYGSTPIR